MTPTTTEFFSPDPSGIANATAVIKRGGLVAFPTETVYGLGADAGNDMAVARIFAAKGRPSFNPLIVHVADAAAIDRFATMTPLARKLAQAFWPGPLTLVLPLLPRSGISELVTTGLDSIAVRVPQHPVAQALLSACAGPVAAPSANPSGRISPTTAQHVMAGLGGVIDAVIDGGSCQVGLESTIVSCVDEPALLRAGGVPVEDIEAVLGQPLVQSADPDRPQSPGQLASHYAPNGHVRLNVTDVERHEVLLGFGDVQADLNLSPTGDLTQAAANLFRYLHQLDRLGATHIAVSPIPDAGIGRAINDRLRRAAAPRG